MRLNGLLLAFCFLTPSAAVVLADNPTAMHLSPEDDWFSILASDSLSPGDEVVLSEGFYLVTSRMSVGHRGTAENPIVIRAAAGANVRIHRPNELQNLMDIEGAQYLTFRDLEFTGGSRGIRIKNKGGFSAKFITLENNIIHDTGDAAVTANDGGNLYEGMVFRGNEIYNTSGTGEGYYLGCNNNGCQFFDGLIENNYIYDLDGPGVTQGDGIEIKDGSYNNIVRNNVIHDTRFPGILAYGTAGNGAPNLFEGNVIWNTGEQGMQIAADAIVRNNIVITSGEEAFRSQTHQGATPGNLTIVNNTFVSNSGSDALRVANTATAPILIANNAIYSRSNRAIRLSNLTNITLDSNVGSGSVSPSIPTSGFDASGNIATDFSNLDWAGPGRDAFPAALSKLIAAGNLALQPVDDFNGTLRAGSIDVGAYVYEVNENPGWPITGEFKQSPVEQTPGDFDQDGDIDGADFLEWQRGFGNSADEGDLDDWQNGYGTTDSSVSLVVPEPRTYVLLIVGLFLGALGAKVSTVFSCFLFFGCGSRPR